MGFQEDLMELLAKYNQGGVSTEVDANTSDDAALSDSSTEVKTEDETISNAPGESIPNETPDNGSSEFDATPIEKAEFDGPPPVSEHHVVATPGDMLAEQIEMRFATFYQEQNEMKTAIKLALDEVKQVKALFQKIETAIDAAADASPAGERIESLINML